MLSPKTRIHLSVRDPETAVAFYEALLGVRPSAHEAQGVTFDLDSPPLVLTIETDPRPRARSPAEPDADGPRERRRRGRFALCLDEPRQVGQVAVALRRAGVRLRLEDQGIEACDPDGNTWAVRYVPSATGCSVELSPTRGGP